MNYTQIFANGGNVSKEENMKDVIKSIFPNLEDSKVNEMLQIGITKYDTIENLYQVMTDVINNTNSIEEAQAAVASVFATNADSQMFKCGGKLQQLISRFGRGGIAECGCGCGGVKLKQEGGIAPKVLQGSTPTRAAALAGLRTVRVPDTNVAKRRRVGAVRDNEGGLHLYESADVNGNSAQTAITIHPGDTVINQSVLRRSGGDPRIIKGGDDNYEPIMQRMRPFVNGVPYKQDGGIVLEDLPGHDVDVTLTRRQARQLAAQNKGFNNEQFSFALANAKNALRNQGLRGRELRERAREMAAGITPVQRSIVDIPVDNKLNVEAPQGFGTATSIKEGILNKPQTSSLDNLSFADAFAQSRKSGAKTFDGRGKSYGTKLAEPKNNEPTMLGEAKIYAPSTQLPEAKIYAPTMLPETRVYPPTVLNEARVYTPTQLPEARVYAPTILGEAVVTPKTNIASISPSITNTSTMTGGIGINRDNLALDEANRRAEERRRAYEQQRANSISPSLVNTSTFKCGGKIPQNKCGGKAKEGIKLVPREKCGGKTKKKK